MKVLERDIRHGVVTVVPETPDDLWVLYNIIRPGDTVVARTLRDVRVEGAKESRRIPITVKLLVKRTEFQPFTTRLRIGGIVLDAPDKYGIKGKHHTINVEPGTRLTIIKEWRRYELERLEKAVERKGMIILVALDYDEAAVGVLSGQGVKIVASLASGFSGKQYPGGQRVLQDYYREVTDIVTRVLRETGARIIVVAGPGFAKERLYDVLKERLRGEANIIMDSVSMGGEHGIRELLHRDTIKQALKEYEVMQAEAVLGVFRKMLITSPDRVAYGLDDVEYCVGMNAVEKVLVAETLLHSDDEETRRRVEKVLEEADRRGAEIIIAPSKSDVEYELLGFAGIVAILRYPLPRDIPR